MALPLAWRYRLNSDSKYIETYRSVSGRVSCGSSGADRLGSSDTVSGPPKEPFKCNSDVLTRDNHPSARACGFRASTKDYIVTNVTWWEDRGWYRHRYIVVKAWYSPRSHILFVRIERGKWDWLRFGQGNLTQGVEICEQDRAITSDSTPLLDYTVRPYYISAASHSLRDIGLINDSLNNDSPVYKFVSSNCWWFSAQFFETLLNDLDPDMVMIHHYHSMWRRRRVSAEDVADLSVNFFMASLWLHFLGAACIFVSIVGILTLVTGISPLTMNSFSAMVVGGVLVLSFGAILVVVVLLGFL